MAKKEVFEIVVPTWAYKSGWEFFGHRDYTNTMDDCASAFISLRAVKEGDKYPWFSDEVRAINNLGFYIWFDSQGTISIDVRCGDTGRQTLREAEAGIRAFRKLNRKTAKGYPMLDNFIRGTPTLYDELAKVLAALGVKRTVRYSGIGTEDAYLPIDPAIGAIADILEKRRAVLRPRVAA